MKLAIALSALILTGCSAIDLPYVKVGAGYKFQETAIVFNNNNGAKANGDSPVSARIEVGANCLLPEVTCGVSHRSQWATGAPFNNRNEYSVTEVFVDYTFYFGK
jgi:hypothetical protein